MAEAPAFDAWYRDDPDPFGVRTRWYERRKLAVLLAALQHPRYGVLKTYLAQIPGPVPRDLGRRLREGIELDDGPVQVDSFRVVDSAPGKALVEVVLHEGRKHIVRRMLAEVGHPVLSLVRVQVGPIHLGDTKPGKWRNLSSAEVGALYAAAEL